MDRHPFRRANYVPATADNARPRYLIRDVAISGPVILWVSQPVGPHWRKSNESSNQLQGRRRPVQVASASCYVVSPADCSTLVETGRQLTTRSFLGRCPVWWQFRKRKQAAEISVELTKKQLGDFYLYYKLIEAMISDPYISGYVSNRVLGNIGYAVKVLGLFQNDVIPVLKRVYPMLFGADTIVIAQRVQHFRSVTALNDEYAKGQHDALAVVQYMSGFRDFSTHPQYAEAVAHSKEYTSLTSVGDERADALVSYTYLTFGERLRSGGWSAPFGENTNWLPKV